MLCPSLRCSVDPPTIEADQSLQNWAIKSILWIRSAPVTTKPQKRKSTVVRGTEKGHKTYCNTFTVLKGAKRQRSPQCPRQRLQNNHSPQEKQERIIHNKQKVYPLHKQERSVNQERKTPDPHELQPSTNTPLHLARMVTVHIPNPHKCYVGGFIHHRIGSNRWLCLQVPVTLCPRQLYCNKLNDNC